MRHGPRTMHGPRIVALGAFVVVLVPLIVAFHWTRLGWRDEHLNYPGTPSGYTQIVNRFGQPCSADAHAISMKWRAASGGRSPSRKRRR